MTITDSRATRPERVGADPLSLLWPFGHQSWHVDRDVWTDLALGALLGEPPGAPPGESDVVGRTADRSGGVPGAAHASSGPSGRRLLARAWQDVPTGVVTARYRQDVWIDVDQPDTAAMLGRFCAAMDRAREQLGVAGRLRHAPQRDAWTVAAVTGYGRALHDLRQGLMAIGRPSAGMAAMRDHLTARLGDPAVAARQAEAERLTRALADVRYVLRIGGSVVGVLRDRGEPDAAQGIARTFARFRQRGGQLPPDRPTDTRLSHVEAAVIDRVARFEPELFADLSAFAAAHPTPFDPAVDGFEREVRTLLAYRELIAPLREAGLPMCLPTLVERPALRAGDVYDLALADRLGGAGVVTNDLHLDPGERIVVITGPNQGGKTTLARTVGQLHLLGALGLPVPGSAVTLTVPDRVVTHFERADRVVDRQSTLEADLRRVVGLLARSGPRTVVLLNEVFSSTATRDAAELGERVLRRLLAIGCLTIDVTFIDELSRIDPAVVSMMSTVEPDDPAVRTHRVVRRPADGRAHAIALAARYGLTRGQVLDRLAGAR